MLLPKKVKHRKWHKGRRRNVGVATRLTSVAFGSYALRAESFGWVNSRQLEAARRVMTRYVKRGGKIWIRVFPDHPVTKKGNEVPMGGGKGSPEYFVCAIKPGTVLFEMDGMSMASAREALESAGYKLPVRSRFVERQ